MRKTIRVLFANCPRLDDAAAAYLILTQNTIQDIFEFEVDHLHVHASEALKTKVARMTARWLDSNTSHTRLYRLLERRLRAHLERTFWPILKRTIPLSGTTDLFRSDVSKHNDWLLRLPQSYGGWSIRSAPTVIITETPMAGGYLSMIGGDVAIISVASWEKYTPPSVVEFALFSVQRAALRMAIHPGIGSHFPTRGCAWDFTAHQPDARLAVVGKLCDSCCALAAQNCCDKEIAQLQNLLSNRWFGKIEEPTTVASTMKRVFGFDLSVARGIRPRFRDRLLDSLPPAIIGAGLTALGFILTSWFRWKGWVH